MSAQVTMPVRRRLRRWRVVVPVLLCVGTVLFVWMQWQTARINRLVAEIEQAGGRVILGTTTTTLLWDRIRGWSGEDPTCVRLGPETTPEWLRSWDDLSDLSIDALKVDQGADLGPELARVAALHPLEDFIAHGATSADEIAAALSNSTTLLGLHLRDSDLTDAGLRRLPLERLRYLNIAGTQITVDGLRELRRLPPNGMVVLDGRQLTAESVAVLEQSPNRYRLWLYGSDITDDSLQMLKTALGPGDTHQVVTVFVGRSEESQISRSAVQEWKRDVPSVEISYTRDAEPDHFRMRSRGITPRPWTRWFGR